MTEQWISAAIVAPLMLLAAAGIIFVVTGIQDRRDRRLANPDKPQ